MKNNASRAEISVHKESEQSRRRGASSHIFSILCRPGAKKNCIKEEGEILKVYVTAQPVDDKANKAVIEMMADYFKVKKSQIEITKGLKSRNKTISIRNY